MAVLTVGETKKLGGYVLVASHIRGRDPIRLEHIPGSRPGRLGQGWYLLFLVDTVSANEF